MKYFTMAELIKSQTAAQSFLNNIPGLAEKAMLEELVVTVSDPLREAWRSPIKLTCAYRSNEVNKKVGGHPNSHHIYGCAADIVCLKQEQDRMMKILIANPHVDLCQNYPDRNFIHVNIARPGQKPRNLALTQYKNQKAIPYKK
ncbi:Peptidase M15 [Brevinema andersonii]|uniref:Peptidase M15 n=1 Tax=Brevinema andersonii TaxID=34097 RepID=A0A1I1FHH7_BREAD|nr:D-Ala-D-Ala carboxypeptidase family metallohydrolase [Brevinema andersonii]SFB96510.1 Peptidase M15 [Brevinema andersonii]